MTALLELQDVDVRYGDFQAVHGVSLRLDEGETMAVMGANGAGKSTLLKAVSGLMATSGGQIVFDGKDIGPVPPHRRVTAGISLVPEGRRIFRSLTVEENLQVGAFSRRPGPWDLRSVLDAFPLLPNAAPVPGRTCPGASSRRRPSGER